MVMIYALALPLMKNLHLPPERRIDSSRLIPRQNGFWVLIRRLYSTPELRGCGCLSVPPTWIINVQLVLPFLSSPSPVRGEFWSGGDGGRLQQLTSCYF